MPLPATPARYTDAMRRRIVILLILASATLTGCGRSLFVGEKANTTQFDTYDRMRGQYKPRTEPDVFGTPQPALRSRLSQNH